MSKGVTASLAGVPLSAHASIRWDVLAGTTPAAASIVTERNAAERIYAKAPGPVELVIDGIVVRELYLVARGPGDSPHTGRIDFVDRRWLWTRKHITRSYNLRKRTGDIRVDGSQRIEIAAGVAGLKFASWSIKGGIPWEFHEALQDVLEGLGLEPSEYEIPKDLGKDVELVDVELDDTGDAALQKLLAKAGGIDVYVDYDGVVKFKDIGDGSEGDELDRVKVRELIRGGHIEVSDRRAQRPRRIDVLFDREVELRFDYDELAASGAGLATVAAGEENRAPRDLVNVVPQTEIDFPRVSRGNWLDVFRYLKNLPSTPGYSVPSHAPGPLDVPFLRKSYLAPWWAKYLYVHDENGNIDQLWARRIQTLRRHYRRTFRLNKVWRDKLRQIKAYRTSVVDEASFTRGRAEAFMGYTAFPTERSLFVRRKDTDRALEGWVVEGYAESLDDAKPAPAELRVVDADNGIIRVYLLVGPYGEETDIIPGRVVGLPELADSGSAFAALRAGYELAADFKMATVLTCVMGAPNNEGRLERVSVTPSDAEKILGRSIGDCDGPPLTIRVGGSDRLAARFCWLDERAADIDEAFFSGTEWPRETFLNRGEIDAYAKAAATRVYSAMLDRLEGRAMFPSADARPKGGIGAVSHGVDIKGMTTTSVELAPEIIPRSFEQFLPEGLRRVITGAILP